MADSSEESGVGKVGEDARNLQAQIGRAEAIRLGSVLHYAISNNVAGVHNVLFARFKSKLVDLTLARQAKKTAASNTRASPVGKTQLPINLRLDAEGVSSPGQKGIPLCDHPVKATVKMNDRKGGEGGFGGDQGGIGSG